MAISDLRFPTRKIAQNAITNAPLPGWVVKEDERGFYVVGDTLPDHIAALPTQAEVDAQRAANPQPVKERKAPAGRTKNGACEMIRAWARENPNASKEDAVAQFPQLNPSTVAIQFRKVRQGLV